MADTKQCSACVSNKPLSAFYKGTGAFGCTSQCKECIKQRKREWWENNRERHKATCKERYRKNAEAQKLEQNDRYETDAAYREAALTRAKAHAKTPKGKASQRAGVLRRRAREYAAAGTVTAQDVRIILSAPVCHYCSEPFVESRAYHPMKAVLDHRVPLSRNGMHCVSNVVAAHARCNAVKNDMTDLEFIAWCALTAHYCT